MEADISTDETGVIYFVQLNFNQQAYSHPINIKTPSSFYIEACFNQLSTHCTHIP